MELANVLGIEFLAIITFIVLLGLALFLMSMHYLCDSFNCKAFKEANAVAKPGTSQYTTILLREMFNDGIWPIPYIGAAILTPLSLWFIGIPISVVNFAILFFVSFVVIYFMLSFFGHHYLRPITTYISDYVDEYCPANVEGDNINNVSNVEQSICNNPDSINLLLPVDISE